MKPEYHGPDAHSPIEHVYHPTTPNITRADGNRFIEALNLRGLCACATRRQLLQLGVPGPYLECERHNKCIHPGVFATERPVEICHTCGAAVPREEL